ncbi:hypothetical protein CTEN210_08252 [Chaetoceros tenuissimus]|uniref:Uncharacterized protein n=1 Tax=Chaetoceros tenuissimus TaxID=426638 RepID=A0AAD3CT88_9STRA|nr:hypothetical protein CTEN210_08252 [Chaetoceros tenuissimus]
MKNFPKEQQLEKEMHMILQSIVEHNNSAVSLPSSLELSSNDMNLYMSLKEGVLMKALDTWEQYSKSTFKQLKDSLENTSQETRSNSPNAPMIGFDLIQDHCSECLFESNLDASIFDEGSSSFDAFLSIDLAHFYEKDRTLYSLGLLSSILTGILCFNIGICKRRQRDHSSSKLYFEKGLDLITQNSYFLQVSMRACSSISFLRALLHINIGHTEWHLRNQIEASMCYQRTIEVFFPLRKPIMSTDFLSLGLEGISSTHGSAIDSIAIYCKMIIAASLNCIAMIRINEIADLSPRACVEDMFPQCEECLALLTPALSIYEALDEYYSHTTPGMIISKIGITNMATILNNMGRVKFLLKDFDASLQFYRHCLKCRTIALPSSHLDVGVAYFNIAQTLAELGKESQAIDMYHKFLSVTSPILGHSNHYVVSTLLLLSDICIREERLEIIDDLLRRYLSSPEYEEPENLRSKISLLNLLGYILILKENCDEALEFLFNARDLLACNEENTFLRKCSVTNSCNTALAFRKIGECTNALYMYQEALDKLTCDTENENKELYQATLCDIHMNMATLHENLEEFDACILHANTVIDTKTRSHGSSHFEVSIAWNYLGLIHFKNNQYQSALAAFVECVHIRSNTSFCGEYEIIAALYNVATVYKSMGELDKALDIFARIIDYERGQLHAQEKRTKPTEFVQSLRQIFEIYDIKNEALLGLRYLSEAVNICREFKDEINPSIGSSIFCLMGDVLGSKRLSEDSVHFYYEGMNLFGINDAIISSTGERAVQMILKLILSDEQFFPLHAAAA